MTKQSSVALKYLPCAWRVLKGSLYRKHTKMTLPPLIFQINSFDIICTETTEKKVLDCYITTNDLTFTGQDDRLKLDYAMQIKEEALWAFVEVEGVFDNNRLHTELGTRCPSGWAAC